ncbi:hypothetical protein AYO40_04295 [Planctomycetaceae bacterium SCGC AG-212-D15]|nr:hypothetical protein AYO40_04295 [Planctomycetaceae bacterium SCGC AG-212-D15]
MGNLSKSSNTIERVEGMNKAALQEFLAFSRRKTLELLEAIVKRAEAPAILGWRPGAGRAHIAWQLMHIAATDDRHLHVRMRGGEPRHPDYVRRFAGGSVPDDEPVSGDEIRRYLNAQRGELLDHLGRLSESDLSIKPNEQAPWAYGEWFQVLAWHEAHHQGQAHLTLNLYRGANDPAMTKVGH